MMASLKVVVMAICILQTAGSSSSLRGDAAEPRELMSGAGPSTGGQPSPGSAGASIPANDATDKAHNNHQGKEATKSEKSEYSPWSQDDMVTLYTVLGVVFLIFGLGLSVTTYMLSKREEKAPLRYNAEGAPHAETDASEVCKPPVVELSLDQKYVVDDSASTQPGSQSPSRRTSHDYGSDAPAPVQQQ